jgi:uncharacterized protein YbcI
MNKGQSIISIIVSIATLFASGAGVGFLYTQYSNANNKIINHEGRISSVEQIVKDMPEMKGDIRFVRDNLIRLMERQGIKTTEEIKQYATTTSKK